MSGKILCATDGTAHSAHAIEFAAKTASKSAAALTLCTINEARGGARGPLIYAHEDADIDRILAEAAETAKHQGAKSVQMVALKSRDTAAAVVRYAEENGFGHIVVGTGDKHGIARLVLGSVAGAIASRAHCTVTIAR
ncbi:MAG: universal stress protein [Rhizobiales bacterium]|nr:universal stress protein [Hyphomicrobiales bacterium]